MVRPITIVTPHMSACVNDPPQRLAEYIPVPKNPESMSTTRIPKKDRPDKKTRVQFGKGSAKSEPQQKSCELCKVMKGVENPAWKTHKTKDCLSKKVNKKRIASTSKDEPLYKH